MTIKITDDGRGLDRAKLLTKAHEAGIALPANPRDEELFDVIFHAVKRSLGHGKNVRIKNFGTFEVTSRPGRIGVNPVSGERIFIQPHKGLSFRPSRKLKDEITVVQRRGSRKERE